jgi:CYTH domain-containing protein
MSPSAAHPKSNHEIERKFLIRKLPEKLDQFPHQQIEQGYLVATRDGRQVRLRRRGDSCTLTFKTADGAVREEREIELGPEQFDKLWPATAGKRLTKTRHEVPWNNFLVEIDLYHGMNQGIVVAEVEFKNERECAEFLPPDWFGEEVTNNPRYSNVALARE